MNVTIISMPAVKVVEVLFPQMPAVSEEWWYVFGGDTSLLLLLPLLCPWLHLLLRGLCHCSPFTGTLLLGTVISVLVLLHFLINILIGHKSGGIESILDDSPHLCDQSSCIVHAMVM